LIRCAIFDCDGTLVDSGATIHRALGLAFEAHGLQLPPRKEAQKVIGLSLVEAMEVLAPDLNAVQHQQLAETYKKAFLALRGAGEVKEPLFEGILPLLDELESRGWVLAVATGKSDRGLRHCLERHGLHPRFLSLQTADRHARSRIPPWLSPP
jgi:phosphoglycolate phosphatase